VITNDVSDYINLLVRIAHIIYNHPYIPFYINVIFYFIYIYIFIYICMCIFARQASQSRRCAATNQPTKKQLTKDGVLRRALGIVPC
jgi:hypothetical protein